MSTGEQHPASRSTNKLSQIRPVDPDLHGFAFLFPPGSGSRREPPLSSSRFPNSGWCRRPLGPPALPPLLFRNRRRLSGGKTKKGKGGMWGLTLQFVCTEKAEKTLEKQFVVERCFISIFYKAKTICCGSDQSQLGAASQSWKTLGKVGFGWVRILIFICGR